MGLFGFGKSYTKDDLDREIAKLRELYTVAMHNPSPQMKRDLASQLHKVMEVCRKGDLRSWETIEWPTKGSFMPLNSAIPAVQVLIDLM